ncbi:MAG TPA: hypothetical protein PKU97_09330 [Kofleriaceae bacterium]|nr:hypothetical protein [Kofleriaceae bacterium]
MISTSAYHFVATHKIVVSKLWFGMSCPQDRGPDALPEPLPGGPGN